MKNFVLRLYHLSLIALPLNVNQRSRELRWLVRVGMFSQNECLLKNTLVVSCMKIQDYAPPCLFLPTPMLYTRF